MKLMKKLKLWLVSRRFNSIKCEEITNIVESRIRALQKERQVKLREKQFKAAELHQKRGYHKFAEYWDNDCTRDENILNAYKVIRRCCKSVINAIRIMERDEECPKKVQEAIVSLIAAAQMCSHLVPELMALANMFEMKYGNKFVDQVTDVKHPSCAVNRKMHKKLLNSGFKSKSRSTFMLVSTVKLSSCT